MKDSGFLRVAAAVPQVKVGRAMENAEEILRMAGDASKQGVQAICFPQLCLTGCTAGDLLCSSKLLDDSLQALIRLKQGSREFGALFTVGLPIRIGRAVFNAVAVICKGRILGICLDGKPSDVRHFQAAGTTCRTLTIDGDEVTASSHIVFRSDNITICINRIAGINADLVLCPAAEAETVGKSAALKAAAMQHSLDSRSAIVLASAGKGESTTDSLYAGHAVIAENGLILKSVSYASGITAADIDIELLHNAQTDAAAAEFSGAELKVVDFDLPVFSAGKELLREIPAAPFQISDSVFEDTFAIQTEALITRLEHIGIKKMIIGISGGLDSTLALLVCANAADRMGLERTAVTGITMPGFGTTDRTYTNAVGMMEALGIERREINIREACLLHLKDIAHDIDVHDSAYENAQARERTQILMDVANENGGLVIGTGDLSELALGWCTYNGDHMSMYAVNASIPKTLIAGIIRHAAGLKQFSAAKANLLDVIDTPITPELLPTDGRNVIVQKTEEIIGPYELHDFFIYHLIHNRFSPDRILFLASVAFKGKYDEDTIRKWLKLFLKRFFNNQFKRSCMPDGPCCGPVSLSPRGGWQMPSDISAADWISEL